MGCLGRGVIPGIPERGVGAWHPESYGTDARPALGASPNLKATLYDGWMIVNPESAYRLILQVSHTSGGPGRKRSRGSIFLSSLGFEI
jgi:hypothetical protein